ncbi:Sodium-independent sulfate anion transporter [Gryllus bimaculatus]|nr:Sodium-independent sulfate anion transporter [Gryllus bimaculatus]
MAGAEAASARAAGARAVLLRRVPIAGWLPRYSAEALVSDLIAGVTVGLTVMPQSLAYATLAGLEPQYGLYSAFVGCFVYALFGSVKDVTIGPTALMALMVYQQVHARNADFAVLLCFLSGCVQLLMAALNLGVLVDFISVPVTVGFTSAMAFIISCSQLKGLLGLKFSSSGFIDTATKVVQHLPETRPWDATLGFLCIFILLFLRKIKDVKRHAPDVKPTPRQRIGMKILWLLSTARNALVVIVCSILAFLLSPPADGSDQDASPFVLTGTVRSGLPPFGLPPFSTTIGNQTYSFGEMCSGLGSSIVLVPILAVLGNVAIAKAFASGDSVDATQELMTLGLCNLLGSFASSFPVSGSFSRSAVNHASGVKTPMGGVFTGLLIILALAVLTPYFYYIPKASLAAVIICAVIFMIEYEVVKPMWKSSRKDLVPAFVTFMMCLILGVEYGIVIGVGVNLIFLLYPSARPMTHSGSEYLLVTPSNSLYFPAVDFIRSSVGRAGITQGSSQMPVIVDCRFVLGADFTAAKGIAALIDDFSKRKQPIYFYNPHPNVLAVFKGANLEEFVEICNPEELEQMLQAPRGDNDVTSDTGDVRMRNFDLREVTTSSNSAACLPVPDLNSPTESIPAQVDLSSTPLLTNSRYNESSVEPSERS